MNDRQNAMGNGRKYKKRFPRNKYYSQINYTDYLSLKPTEEKSTDFIENANFGFEYEDTICTKSCVNLKIKSINEKKLYTREYKHFWGLKLILIKQVNNLPEDYIGRLLDEGKYKVVSFSNNYTKLSYENNNFYISYNGKGLYLLDEYYKCKKLIIVENHKSALLYSGTSYKDNYIGTFSFIINNEINLDLIIYSSACEVDGVFDVVSDIELSEYKTEIIYKNYFESNIKANSLLIYDIKSGKKQKNLLKQMKKRCHFIVNYIKFIYKHIQDIYYFGFYREDGNLEVISNEYDSIANIKEKSVYKNEELKQEKYYNKKERFGEINNNNNEENNSYETQYSSKNKELKGGKDSYKFEELKDPKKENLPSKEESKQYTIINEDTKEVDYSIEKEHSNSEKHGEEKTKENSCRNSVDKSEQEIKEVNDDYTNKNKFKELKNNLKLEELDKLPAKIAIFKLSNTIFGENLKYNREELNLISNLKDDVHGIIETNNILNARMNSIEGKVDSMKGDIDYMKGDINSMKSDINSMKGQITEMKREFDRKFQLLFDKFEIKDNSQLSINEKK